MPRSNYEPPHTYFLYCRKSTDTEDRQILSLDSQEIELKELAKRMNLTVREAFRESKSAKAPGRPVFTEMLTRLNNGEADGIICWKLDRLSRNPVDGGALIWAIKDKHIQVVTPSQTFSQEDDNSIMMYIEFGMAQKYIDDLGKVVKRGNRHKFFEKRQWGSHAKPGYKNIKDEVTGECTVIPDDRRFPLLQQALYLIIDGSFTPMEALHTLNESWGCKTKQSRKLGGKPLSRTAFYHFLSDTFYYGLMRRNLDGKIEEITGAHKPMLTKEQFDRLQIRLGRKGKPHLTQHDFPYKSVLKCGECGGSIGCQEKWQIICPICKRKFHRGKKTFECPQCHIEIEKMQDPKILHYVYYRCNKKTKPDCTQKHLEIKRLETQIIQELEKFEIPESFQKLAIKYLNEATKDEVSEREVIRKNQKRALDDSVLRLDNLLKLYISPQNTERLLLSEEKFISEQKILMQEKERLEQLLTETSKRQNEWLELSIKTFDFACYAKYWFQKGDIKAKTRILDTLGNNLRLEHGKLLIDKEKSFLLIEKSKSLMNNELKKFEPKKEIDISTLKTIPEALCNTWLGNQDSNLD